MNAGERNPDAHNDMGEGNHVTSEQMIDESMDEGDQVPREPIMDESQSHMDGGDHVPPSQQVVDESQGHPSQEVLQTQDSCAEYLIVIEAEEAKAAAEFQALRGRIENNTDPSAGAKEHLLTLAKEAWDSVGGNGPFPEALETATTDMKFAFFNQWSKVVLSQENLNPGEIQEETPLEALAPRAVAHALQRVAAAHGLPPDGHVVHLAFKGQAAFYWHGPEGSLQNAPMGQYSESTWNVGASKLPGIVTGNSSAGKGNVKTILMRWIEALRKEELPATSVLRQGNLTLTGVLTALKENEMPILQIVNEELDKILRHDRKDKLQEADLIEFLDQSPAFGLSLTEIGYF